MVMMRTDTRLGGVPASPPKKLGEAAGEAVPTIANDALQLGKKGFTASDVDKAIEREATVRHDFVLANAGTLGACPNLVAAQQELHEATAALDTMRKADPKLVAQVEAQREVAKAQGASIMKDMFRDSMLALVAPPLWAWNKLMGLFRGKD